MVITPLPMSLLFTNVQHGEIAKASRPCMPDGPSIRYINSSPCAPYSPLELEDHVAINVHGRNPLVPGNL